jgi:hypothetical protein
MHGATIKINTYRISVWKSQEKDLLGELGLGGRVIVE